MAVTTKLSLRTKRYIARVSVFSKLRKVILGRSRKIRAPGVESNNVSTVHLAQEWFYSPIIIAISQSQCTLSGDI